MPRFVILTHDWPDFHWDFFLEAEGKLLSWRVLSEPLIGVPLKVERTPDHRLDYLEITGPVSGGRGEVAQWDLGTYKLECSSDGTISGSLQSKRLNRKLEFRITENRTLTFTELDNST